MSEGGGSAGSQGPVSSSSREADTTAPSHQAHGASGEKAGSVPLFDDLGDHVHPITTSTPLAQKYFDQGFRLLYAFNPEEAKLSFDEAVKIDPNCAICWWGIAYSLGPNINVPRLPDQEREAAKAIQKALALSPHASESERAYITALSKRYSTDPHADAKAMDRAYADAMREVAGRYPDDLDAATLYAEALMDLRPWQLWTLDYQPQPGTLEILSILESVLKRDPNHPGANHYYVHAVEASDHPEKALPSTEKLKTLMPGAGHLVHMPFHIYSHLGRYDEAAKVNERAVAVDRAYIEKYKRGNLYAMMYYPHNIHSLCASLTMEGRSAEALRAARDLAAAVPPKVAQEMQMTEFFTPVLLVTQARFGKWDAILAEPKPPSDLKYLTGIWHYTRCLAFTATGRMDEAAAEATRLSAIQGSVAPDLMESLNPAGPLLKVGMNVLAGEMAAKQGRIDEAIRSLEEAVRDQDALNYDEPAPWYYPVRQSLGAVLLVAKRPADAEDVYRKDLQKNPENGWSLFGLEQSLRAQGKTDEAAATEKRFRAAWARADVTLSASRFM